MTNPLIYARQKTARLIKERFNSFLMNNKKWVKVIRALSEPEDLVKECKVKLVWDENLRKLFLKYASYHFDYYDTSMEAMISGYPKGFYDYKEIQWFEFPAQAKVLVNTNNLKAGNKFVVQDIQKISNTISELGQFELEMTESYLRLYGYK